MCGYEKLVLKKCSEVADRLNPTNECPGSILNTQIGTRNHTKWQLSTSISMHVSSISMIADPLSIPTSHLPVYS